MNDRMPCFGVSSLLHFAALCLAWMTAPGLGVRQAGTEFIRFTPPSVRAPETERTPPPEDDKAPPIRDWKDAEAVGQPSQEPPSERAFPVHDDLPSGPEPESEDGGDRGRSGDPNQSGPAPAAFQIDTFFRTSALRTVRGLGDATGRNERFGQREPGGRYNLTRVWDPSGRTQDAVKRALAWLKRHQSPDGRWDCDGFEAACRNPACTGPGSAEADVGVSGLALLAFLGHGDTALAGDYQDTVRRGLAYLKGTQSADGCVGPRTGEKHLYNHAIATLALAEAVGMGDYAFKESAQKAVDYLVACQNPVEKGGAWRYRNYNLPDAPAEQDGDNDTSVTGWAVMALKSAKEAELRVPDAAFAGASAFLNEVFDAGEDYKGTFGYTKKRSFVHKSPATTTAVGVLVRQLMGQNQGVREGCATLLESPPDWKRANLYTWYYATLALFQVGGESWGAWNRPLKAALCEHQETKGCADGSWDPAQDTWGSSGGRVYTTAMGALNLEVYYRYRRGMRIAP